MSVRFDGLVAVQLARIDLFKYCSRSEREFCHLFQIKSHSFLSMLMQVFYVLLILCAQFQAKNEVHYSIVLQGLECLRVNHWRLAAVSS